MSPGSFHLPPGQHGHRLKKGSRALRDCTALVTRFVPRFGPCPALCSALCHTTWRLSRTLLRALFRALLRAFALCPARFPALFWLLEATVLAAVFEAGLLMSEASEVVYLRFQTGSVYPSETEEPRIFVEAS